MQDVMELDTLADEVQRLLARQDSLLEDESIHRQVEKLTQWLDSRRRQKNMPATLSPGGAKWLADLRGRLKLAVEERQRLEGEGGIPVSREQAEKTEAMLITIRRINKLLPSVPRDYRK